MTFPSARDCESQHSARWVYAGSNVKINFFPPIALLATAFVFNWRRSPPQGLPGEKVVADGQSFDFAKNTREERLVNWLFEGVLKKRLEPFDPQRLEHPGGWSTEPKLVNFWTGQSRLLFIIIDISLICMILAFVGWLPPYKYTQSVCQRRIRWKWGRYHGR